MIVIQPAVGEAVHEQPLGEETVKLPLPPAALNVFPVLDRVYVHLAVKVAVTDLLAVIVTLQVFPDDESQPFQLAKMEFASGVAVTVTSVPGANEVPDGLLLVVPAPVPA